MINVQSTFRSEFRLYYITAIFSLIFAVVGFSYNAWRMEVSESNSNIRTAAFESLAELARLQQLVYAAHYDNDKVMGNPRVGWVKVELIVDYSTLIDSLVHEKALSLKDKWSYSWELMPSSRQAVDGLIEEIEAVQAQIRLSLSALP